MKGHERTVVTIGFTVLIFAWLGFLLHVSPRFAGSGLGAVFGISGAVLMLAPLAYVVVKRSHALNARVTKHVSLQTLMSVHVYTGLAGALLALIHTGHKYNSTLGIALTATMILVIASGFVARYLVSFVSLDMKDKLMLLQTARGDLDSAWGEAERATADMRGVRSTRLLGRGLALLGLSSAFDRQAARITLLAEGVADLEYSVRTHELLKTWFSRTLTIHIYLSVALYILLAAHIVSGIYFGLRWLS